MKRCGEKMHNNGIYETVCGSLGSYMIADKGVTLGAMCNSADVYFRHEASTRCDG